MTMHEQFSFEVLGIGLFNTGAHVRWVHSAFVLPRHPHGFSLPNKKLCNEVYKRPMLTAHHASVCKVSMLEDQHAVGQPLPGAGAHGCQGCMAIGYVHWLFLPAMYYIAPLHSYM